jgi:protein phosphatase
MPTTKPRGAVAAQRKPRDDEVDVYGATHIGTVRKVNQDHFLICQLEKRVRIFQTSLPNGDAFAPVGERMAFLAMVADGVGGGSKGEAAARLALHAVTEYVTLSMRAFHTLDTTDDQAFLDALQEAAWKGHARVVAEAEGDPDLRGMATTLTLWLAVWPRAYLLQVGDSRFYQFANGGLMRLSRDQTMAQELVDQGVLQHSTAFQTRWANVLSSSIGGSQTAPVVTRMDQEWDTVYMLCSDGLTKHVSDDRIAERLGSMTSAKQVCHDLLQDALDDGGSDNITVIVGRDVKNDE